MNAMDAIQNAIDNSAIREVSVITAVLCQHCGIVNQVQTGAVIMARSPKEIIEVGEAVHLRAVQTNRTICSKPDVIVLTQSAWLSQANYEKTFPDGK